MEINIEKNKQDIVKLLRSTKREGIEKLICLMDVNGFFTAPCSTQYHLAVDGGLAEHSLNVYTVMTHLADTLAMGEIDDETIIITAILHDLGKMGDFEKPNYVENVLKKTGKRSESKPFETNKALCYVPHEIRSAIIAQRFIKLTEEEEHAIIYHNGMYSELKYSFQGHETRLDLLLHFADMWCSRVVEVSEDGEAE